MTSEEIFKILKDNIHKTTCRRRNYVSAIVDKENNILGMGWTHSLDKKKCTTCIRESLNVLHGERYELCQSVHAEQAALINLAFNGHNLNKAYAIYLYGIDDKGRELDDIRPCLICEKLIKEAEIEFLITPKGKCYV